MLAIYQGTVVKFADTALPKAYKSPCLHGMYLLKSIWIPLFIRKCHWLGISFHLPFLNEPHRSISRFFTLLFLPGCQLRVTLSLSLGSSVHLFLGGPVTNCQDDHIEQNTTFYMDNLNIIFTSCCVGSSLCQPDRMRTQVYLWFVLATHTPMPLNPRGQVSLQHVTFTQYLPCCCHGRIQGERKLGLYSSWQLNTSVTLSKALFLFFASWGFLIQFLSQEHFLPQLFTKGLYGDGDHTLYFYFPRRISFLHPFP